MKKYSIYIAILMAGILVGWLIFGNAHSEQSKAPAEQTEVHEHQQWTCSMHPQIVRDEPGDCPICGMELIPLKKDKTGLTADQFRLTKDAAALADVQTSIVQSSGSNSNNLELSGKIVEDETLNKALVSHYSGRIEKLYLDFTGESVRKGQKIALIYSPELLKAQQELLTAYSLRETQPRLYQSVRNKLKIWKLTESQIQEIEQSGKVKENISVYATEGGTVIKRLIETGDYIKQGQPLYRISNLHNVWANFDIYENEVQHFKTGQSIDITTRSLPGEHFKAKVDFIQPTLNTETRTVTLRANLVNSKQLLKPGMFVKGAVEINSAQSSGPKILLVPATAILWTGKRSVVYLKSNPDEPIFEMREVTLGSRIGDNYEVTDGLFEGNEVVTNGVFTIDAAAQLQGKKSMMNRSANPALKGGMHHHHDMSSMNQAETKQMDMPAKEELSREVVNKVSKSYDVYLQIKDALVNDNAKESKQFAINLKEAIDQITSQSKPFKKLRTQLNETLKTFIEKKDLTGQRKSFIHLSMIMKEWVSHFSHTKSYLLFCPMANDNAGAYWLSNEKKIKNPYFGKDMMNCGEVKDSIN